jgi:hypothetical protein
LTRRNRRAVVAPLEQTIQEQRNLPRIPMTSTTAELEALLMQRSRRCRGCASWRPNWQRRRNSVGAPGADRRGRRSRAGAPPGARQAGLMPGRRLP